MPAVADQARSTRDIFYLESAPTVEPEAGIIRRVKVIGHESKNGRIYSPMLLANSFRKYEGAKVYINHPRRSELQEDRGFQEWAGNIRNPHLESDGIYADLHLRKKAKAFEEIIEAATDFWKDFGLSHVADCRGVKRDGKEHIESINEVYSVDIVTDPATTAGLFESRNPMAAPKKVTVKSILAAVSEAVPFRRYIAECVTRKVLTEETEVEVADDATSDDQLNAAAAAALNAPTPEARKEAAEALTKMAATPATPKPNEGGDNQTEEAKTAERLKQLESQLALTTAKTMLLESGREATEIRVKALAAAAEGDRKSLLESWPVKESNGGNTRESRPFARPDSSPPANSGGNAQESTSYKAYESKWDARAKANREKLAKAGK